MKKLTIADVKSFEILSKEERKMVIGGTEGSGGTGGTCGTNYWKDGVRVKCFRNMSREAAIAEQSAWKNDADGRYLYDYVYYCCEQCDACSM